MLVPLHDCFQDNDVQTGVLCLQYPDNAKVNRKQFMLDFIMTGKIQVRRH